MMAECNTGAAAGSGKRGTLCLVPAHCFINYVLAAVRATGGGEGGGDGGDGQSL